MSHRVFKPVILFHDHSYSTDPSGVTHRIHIPYGDPHYTPLIQQKKHKVGLMLQTNGRAWYDIIKSSQSKYKTPKPSAYTTTKKRHYYQAAADSSSEEDDDNHSTMTSSSSSCTTNSSSSNNSIASPIPTSKAASTSTTTASNNNTMIARKRRGNLPKTVTAVLKQWLVDHCRNPYPTEVEKTGLKDKTGLTLNQISNWFINARRRLLPQILATMHPNHKETNGMLHHHHPQQQQHHTLEDEDDEDEDEEGEEDEDDMIPMPQPQKRRRKNFLYNTNNQQAHPPPPPPPTTVVRKRRRYNKRSNAVLS